MGRICVDPAILGCSDVAEAQDIRARRPDEQGERREKNAADAMSSRAPAPLMPTLSATDTRRPNHPPQAIHVEPHTAKASA